MPRPRLAMRKVRDILRLAVGQGLSHRQVGAAVGVPFTTVADHLRRAREAGLGWPLPEGLNDAALEALLFRKEPAPPTEARPLPDWEYIHRELRRPAVTLMLLWLEYKERHPEDGYLFNAISSLVVGRVLSEGGPWSSGLRSWGEGGLDGGDDLSSVFAGGAEHLLADDLAAVFAAVPDLA